MPLLLLCLLCGSLIAAESASHPVLPILAPEAGRLPVLHHGRIKPLAVAAEEVLLAICGRPRFGLVVGEGPAMRLVERWDPTRQLLSLALEPEAWRPRPLVWIPYQPLRQQLGLGEWASLVQLDPLRDQLSVRAMQVEAQRQARQELDRLELEVEAVVRRHQEALSALAGQSVALAPLAGDADRSSWCLDRLVTLLPIADPGDRPWRSALRSAALRPSEARHHALLTGDPWLALGDLMGRPDPVLAALSATGEAPASLSGLVALASAWGQAQLRDGAFADPGLQRQLEASLRQAGEERDRALALAGFTGEAFAPYPSSRLIGLENLYRSLRPFTWVWVLFIVAALCSGWELARGGSPGLRRCALVCSLLALAVCVFGLGCRLAITRLGAVANLYETLVFVSFISGLLGLLLDRWRSQRHYLLAGCLAGAFCAMIGEALPPQHGSSIGPLMPVLRSRFWLWIHVKVVVAAYAAFVLAWILGNLQLWRAWRQGREVGPGEGGGLYLVLQVGLVLMVAGTLLGAWWGDMAWGRFWGWDAKEVAALIIILVYLVPLHLRYAGAVGPTGLAAWGALGVLSVLWSWYGVNFILASGMHAYGQGISTEKDKVLVILGVAIQIGLVAFLMRGIRAVRAGP